MKFPDEFVEKLATNKQIKFVYRDLVNDHFYSPRNTLVKWEMASNENIKWHTHFSLIKQTCRVTYIMTFQFKFLHRIIPTNIYLYKVNIKDNERCSFCKNEPESPEHLFFDCPIVKDFWNNLSRKLISYYPEFDLNGTEIFIGSHKKDLFLNWLFIVAKNYIFKCKLKESKPNMIGLEFLIRNYYNSDRILAIKNDTIAKFELLGAIKSI